MEQGYKVIKTRWPNDNVFAVMALFNLSQYLHD